MAPEEPELRLLVVQASPRFDGDDQKVPQSLDLDAEWQHLRAAIQHARNPLGGTSAQWMVQRFFPQGEKLRKRLFSAGFDIIHFGCHRRGSGLWLENGRERGYLLEAAALVDEIKPHPLRLAVLVSCDSRQIGQTLLGEGTAACVVITNTPILDSEARLFCNEFYGVLAQGRSVAEALYHARAKLQGAAFLDVIGDSSWRPSPVRGLRVVEQPIRSPLFPSSRDFVGRQGDLDVIERWLNGSRPFMVLSAPAGAGKKALAAKAADCFGQDFQALVFVAPKQNQEFGPQQVLDALRDTLGLPRDKDPDPLDAIAKLLRQESVFLILADVDSISQEAGRALAIAMNSMEEGSPSKVLLTTRFARQTTSSLLSNFPPREYYSLRALSRVDALRLIFENCHRIDHEGLGPPAGPDPVAANPWKLLHTQAGLPANCHLSTVAALDELAHLAFLHPSLLKEAGALAATMDYANAIQLLGAPRPDGPQAEYIKQTMSSLEDQRLLPTLYAAVPFIGGASDEHLLRMVLGTGQEEKRHWFRIFVLQPLVDLRLLDHDQIEDRYQLARPVRFYFEQFGQLSDSERSKWSRLHAEAFLDVVRSSVGSGNKAEMDWGNIGPAVDWLSDQVRTRGEDWRVASMLVAYAMSMRGEAAQGRLKLEWLEAARLAARQIHDSEGEAHILVAIGDAHWFQARNRYEEALRLFQTRNDMHAEAAGVLKILGDMAWARASMDPPGADRALAYYSRALALFAEQNDRTNLALIEEVMGLIYLTRSPEEAAACFQRAKGLRAPPVALLAETERR